ncbi:DEAH-box RNA helicase PRP16 PWA37_004722 [Arxiozyma heterogenica]|uniref:Pre-mRNA-splicing factor ATP-dependent RNA helicase PRP16 n=1 Tax=Arxiozyma heterogenica TaxID=278026 RepID=A0AAN7ZSZ4_9SACH|nr:hypothetical protein RI543_001129 [Kazachstania heterogenica]
MNDDLSKWIQAHSTSSITPNLFKIIQRLAITKNTFDDFYNAVSVVLKLRGGVDRLTFFKELYSKLRDSDSNSTNRKNKVHNMDSDTNTNNSSDIGMSKTNTTLLEITEKRKRLIPLSFDNEDGYGNEEDDELDYLSKKQSVNVKKIDPKRIIFKKLEKSTASKLKEYSNSKYVGSENPFIKPSPNISVTISGKKTAINNSDRINNDEENTQDYYYCFNDLAKDDQIEFSNVQLCPVSIDKKKDWLPSFLLDYCNKYKIPTSAIVGSISDSSHMGIINPFKNPNSTFSQMARKGSQLVNLKRLTKEQKTKNHQNVQLANTAMGAILGVQDNDTTEMTKKDTILHNNKNIDKKYLQSQEEIQNQRLNLPAYKVKDELISLVLSNQVVIVIGETGSGKTTQLPQILYEAGFCRNFDDDNNTDTKGNSNSMMIGVTQPRRVAAISVAKRVALEMNTQLGSTVGYAIRFEDITSSDTKIKFMTDGILLREFLLDPFLTKYNCIIIDEAHERSLNTDVLLGMFKNLLTKRKDIKLIITSATMNATKFSKFLGNAPQFTIPGRTYPVQINYSKTSIDDYVEAAVIEAVRIHLQTPVSSGDVLIFMTGQEDIEITCDSIKNKLVEVYSKKHGIDNFEEINDIEIYPIYSALSPELQNRIFHKLEPSKRKIVVSTNIAETSLTIDGIRYVIDCGYSKLKVFNPSIGLDSLMVTPISLANANQRSGRAGRTGPGIAYRLYTEETAEEDMYIQPIPEIQRTSLTNTLLLLKSLGVKDCINFPFLDKPPLQTLLESMYELWFLGAINNYGNLTSLGRQMAQFPLQVTLSKALIVASKNKCSEELVTIVSMLSVPQVFHRPKEREKESDSARERFLVPMSDHLTLLNVYNQWVSNQFSAKWCEKHFLIYRSLVKAREIRNQLIKIMKKNKIPIVSSGTNWDIVRKCICSAFAHQASKVTGLRRYVDLRTGMKVELHPTSVLFGIDDPPNYVVYHELLMTTREYMCYVTAVNPFWLMEFGPLIYDIKKISTYDEDNITTLFGSKNSFEISNEKNKSDDIIDERIKYCLVRREGTIKQLNKDINNAPSSKFIEKRTNANNQNNIVTIGLKRRKRPF